MQRLKQQQNFAKNRALKEEAKNMIKRGKP